ncbi:MAG: prephenate dehydratase [Ferruginibacter sp.]
MNDLTKPVAIQGFEGSFHQQAAQLVFGKNAPMLFCASFRELIKTAKDRQKTSAAVMAIENSIAGSILPNYNLLHQSNQVITGEIYLHIKQQLIVNPGVELEDIREVHSHPMALQQCFDFLDKYNWKLVETEDTALSAKHIKQHKSKHVAAIAGKLAAEIFDLKIIAPNIHTLKNNYTRFLILQRDADMQIPADANKASVYFHTDHSRGSLAKVLTAIAGCGINLSKLQSFPIPGSEWLYAFHADMEFEQQKSFTEVMKKIKPLTKELKLYGVYKKGETK